MKKVNAEIDEGEEGKTRWYLGEILTKRNDVCTISFDRFDKLHDIKSA